MSEQRLIDAVEIIIEAWQKEQEAQDGNRTERPVLQKLRTGGEVGWMT